MKSIRLTAILDKNGEVHIPVPLELRSSPSVDVEVFFREAHSMPKQEWAALVASIDGIFKDSTFEVPDDPPPDLKDFEE